jgi:hypothetical protein
MQISNETWLTLIVLCLLLPAVLVLVAAAWAFTRGPRLLMPSQDDLQQQFTRMKARTPDLPPDKWVNQIIQRQALRCGVVGALTSVGGVVTLPFGLALDVLMTARIQNATLHFIAWAYGRTGREPILKLNDALALREDNVTDYVLSSTPAVSQRITARLLTILAEKTIAKIIPGLGLIIGFIVNYAMARGTSWLAARWYASRAGAAR